MSNDLCNSNKLYAEETIQETLHTFMLDQVRDSILLMNTDGYILYANQTALLTYQYSLNELKTMRIHQLRALITAESIHLQLKKAQEQGILFRTVHIRKDRTTFVVEVNSRQCFLHGKELIISVIRDTTQIIEIEESLKMTEAKYLSTNEELAAAYEELLASDEELRQQFDELMMRDQEIQRSHFLLQSLHEGMLSFISHSDSNDILQKMLDAATTLAETSQGFIYHLDKKNNRFIQSHGLGVHACCNGISFPCDQGIAGQVYQTKELVITNSYLEYKQLIPPPVNLDTTFNHHSFSFDSISAMLLVPLKAGQDVIGIIGLTHYGTSRNFSKEEISTFIKFAEMSSIILANTSLLQSYQDEIQERQKTETQLRKLQSANQALLNSIPDPLFILSSNGTFLDYKAQHDQSCIPSDTFLGSNISAIFEPALAEVMMQHIHCALESAALQTFEYQLLNETGLQYYEARLVPNGQTEVMAIIRDITDRYQMEKKMRYTSMHDSLTDVYNRAYFEEHMKHSAQTHHKSSGLIICDVDGLKLINDTSGHAVGDMVLKHISNIIKNSFGPNDIVARIGGDEFAVLVYDQTEKDFEEVCCHIRNQLQIYNQEHIMIPISISLGYASTEETPPDMDALFREADTNMYREKLHQKQSAKSSIVQALVKALEARDYLTEGHGDRMQDLVEEFSKNIGLPERQIADFRLLAHFHDIGKVGIPDSILFKPGPLSEEEWVIMRQHTDIGYRIANSVSDLHPIANWILSHHEHWNGNGYPRGIAGEEIPLACRILAIADTYDAMTSDRPYRKAVSPQKAFAELEKFAGIQFDPTLTQKFIRLFSKSQT